MRIIAGSARGRRLKGPDTRGTRPVTGRVREAVFSSIGEWVRGAVVADLYAGSGSFGLEALSRGASSALFVEKGRKALEALEANVRTLGLGGLVVAGEVRSYLNRAEEVFDLVFIDPPWDLPTTVVDEELALLDRVLAPDARVIVSRRSTDRAPRPPETWRVATDKRYGDTRIFRYEKVSPADDQGTVPREL
jgi:16S rRNA (guanine966-N2)-methyltransferase